MAHPPPNPHAINPSRTPLKPPTQINPPTTPSPQNSPPHILPPDHGPKIRPNTRAIPQSSHQHTSHPDVERQQIPDVERNGTPTTPAPPHLNYKITHTQTLLLKFLALSRRRYQSLALNLVPDLSYAEACTGASCNNIPSFATDPKRQNSRTKPSFCAP